MDRIVRVIQGCLSCVAALALLLGACAPAATLPEAGVQEATATGLPLAPEAPFVTGTLAASAPAASPLPPLLSSPTATLPPARALALGQRTEPGTLHPLVNTLTGGSIILSALFAPCTRRGWQSGDHAWVPEMCASAPTLENGGARWMGEGPDRYLEVTFRLKDGWTWHDGAPVTAHDYVYTWKLALDPALYGQVYRLNEAGAYWLKIHQVEAPDDRTLILRYHNQKTLEAEASGQGQFPGMQAEYDLLKEVFPSGPVVSASRSMICVCARPWLSPQIGRPW